MKKSKGGVSGHPGHLPWIRPGELLFSDGAANFQERKLPVLNISILPPENLICTKIWDFQPQNIVAL